MEPVAQIIPANMIHFVITLSVLSLIDVIYHFCRAFIFEKSKGKRLYHGGMTLLYISLAAWGKALITPTVLVMSTNLIVWISILSALSFIDTMYHLYRATENENNRWKRLYHTLTTMLYIALAMWGISLIQ